jgi:hypothetical protein
MKCIGYDDTFQKEISKTYPNWVSPLPNSRKRRKEVEARERKKRKFEGTSVGNQVRIDP